MDWRSPWVPLWWQPEDLRSGKALVTGPQGEAHVLPSGYSSVLLQTWHTEARATGRNIADESLALLQQWASEGEVIHGHMVMDAGCNMMAALNVVGFKSIMFMAHKLQLVVLNAIGWVSISSLSGTKTSKRHGHSWHSAANWWATSHTA